MSELPKRKPTITLPDECAGRYGTSAREGGTMGVSQLEIIRRLVEVIEAAIRAGDWEVDGACDPDSILGDAEGALRAAGYSRGGITG